jgi:hypothetical protein
VTRSIGRAGGSLADTSWATNDEVAAIGAKGERLTAKLLKACAGDATVLHDLDIPIAKMSANIDHAVVTGRRVLLVDTKMWKPGRYVTVFGRTFRGWSRFEFADKETMVIGLQAFRAASPSAKWERPVVVVHPSNGRAAVDVRRYRPRGAAAADAVRFEQIVRRLVERNGPADPQVVSEMSRFVRRQRSSG